ncbi:hypothetical protein PMAYCL1PPCAC_27655, partial [Pristionchus mayeri]
EAHELSFADYKQINLLYKCSESCPTQPECLNGGYAHPKECNRCICPDFYTGVDCGEEKMVLEITQAPDGKKIKVTLEKLYARKE